MSQPSPRFRHDYRESVAQAHDDLQANDALQASSQASSQEPSDEPSLSSAPTPSTEPRLPGHYVEAPRETGPDKGPYQWGGRIGRKLYAYWTIGLYAFSVAFAIESQYLDNDWIKGLGVWVLLALVVFNVHLSMNRSRDIGWKPWWGLVVMVPYLGFLFTFVLLLKKSKPLP